jgi:hypothetical protein
MKKLLLFLTLCLISTIATWAQTATAPTGSGTEGDPCKRSSHENLSWLSQKSSNWGKYYEQTADINASATSTWDIESGFSPIGNSTTNFTGTYNGAGYTY